MLLMPMKATSFIVTTSDGKTFRCFVQPVGERLQRRWVFADPSGKHHVGPPFEHTLTEAQVQSLVSTWWEDQKNARKR
ncbi:MAG TPA: hypothetical protein VGM67_13190 [Gemmatimonadaceae bacterium]|jgi:hypothetical protein